MSEKVPEKQPTEDETPEIKVEGEDPPAEPSSLVQGAEGGTATTPQASPEATEKKGKVSAVTSFFKKMTPPSKGGSTREKSKSPSGREDASTSAGTSKDASPPKEDETPRRSDRLREGTSGTSDLASSFKYVKDKIASVGRSRKKRDAEKDQLCAQEGEASPRKQPKRSTKGDKRKKKRVHSPSGVIHHDDPRKLKEEPDSCSSGDTTKSTMMFPESSKDEKSSSISDLSLDVECSNDDESSSSSEESSDKD